MNDAANNPYAASQANLDQEVIELELAERGDRLKAVLLDGLFYLAALIPFFIVLFLTMGLAMRSEFMIGLVGGVAILGVLGVGIYNFVLFHRQGQTLGKRIMGVKVVRSNGDRCSLRRFIFMRYLLTSVLASIPFIGIFVSIADPLLIFRESRQCLHDTIADTIVVNA